MNATKVIIALVIIDGLVLLFTWLSDREQKKKENQRLMNYKDTRTKP
jgi:hypothetical protein